MTRKDLQEKYNILGENKDITLFRKRGEFTYGIGYCGNVTLRNGKAVLNGKSYSDIDSLDKALVEWGESLPYHPDTYCPMYNEQCRTDFRLHWYMTEKMGFKVISRDFEAVYVKPIGSSFNLEFTIEMSRSNDTDIDIISKYGEYFLRQSVNNAEDGIAVIETIINTSVLEMAEGMVDALSICKGDVAAEVEAYTHSDKSVLGFEQVDFKGLMIARLEAQLRALRGE